MNVISKENAGRILADLVALASVNPMGRPYDGAQPVERGVVEYLEQLFAPYGIEVQRQSFGSAHENLLIVVPGRSDGPCALLESHMDTVPADVWLDRAFTPRREGDLLFGCGACDDKGPLVGMVLAVLDLLESGTAPPQPVLLLAAGDEEYAQTGIKHFVRTTGRTVGRGVFGEPTSLIPVIQHKGTVRWDITVHGRSSHSSRPELGSNAILGMMQVIEAIGRHQAELQRRYKNPLMTGPTLTVTKIEGGRTRNAVPDACTIALDFRTVPEMDRTATREEIIRAIATLGLEVTHADLQINTPALNTPPSHPFVKQVLGICGEELGREIQPAGAPYGTDAAWISERAPAVVLGPGDIGHAHAADERVDLNEVVASARIYREIVLQNPE